MSIAVGETEKTMAGAPFLTGALALAALLSMFMAAGTEDTLFRAHAYLLMGAFTLGAGAMLVAMTTGGFRQDTRYMDGVIKAGVVASMVWALVGLAAGCLIAAQLSFPEVFYFPEAGWLNFGRLRPVHTSGVIFAFGGNVLIATSFWVVQRTCKARLFGGVLPWFVFWGYQLFIVLAATGYLLGITQSREYAEPEWYVDLWLTVVWVAYLVTFLGTIWNRQEKHVYVANWFYLAFIVTIAILHLINNAAIPVALLSAKSYGAFAGVQDALVQWWYGHNAVGFFLTAGFLAIMYYFVPKRAGRPVYSYRLSIVHFWALIFIYIWAGPHHLHYTALPQWAQTLGMTFSIMLWMPSWGGMINGLMTLQGAWDKLRTDPIIKMLVVSIAFYGMSTFEGPLMSVRAVNSLSHYTDWTIGHVHSGALGWVGFVSFGAMYMLVPWLWRKKEMYSLKLIDWHLWIATTGLVLYIASMWVSGVMEGLMWRAYTPEGFLQYSFVETVSAKHVSNVIRLLGGLLYLTGAGIMAFNFWKTLRMPAADAGEVPAVSPTARAPLSDPIPVPAE